MSNPVTTDAPLTLGREFRVVSTMALGFGLVGIDRFLITTMYPTIAHDLHLNYSDIGTITGALAFAWGASALFTGNLSDRLGRRVVLTASLIVFSLLIGASGIATGLSGLIMVRIVMGIADGAYTPTSIAATLESSPPKRHGLSIGIQQMMLPLCGLGLAPLIVGPLLDYIEWRYIFLIFVIPGLLLAFAVWKFVPAKPAVVAPVGGKKAGFGDVFKVLGYGNITVGALLMLCWLTCLVSTSAFLPNYLVDFRKLSNLSMGTVMSSIGLGSFVGTLLLPWLSDFIGRKPVMILSTVGAAASLIALNFASDEVGVLFACLFMVHFFNNALITLTVGPLCAETVPVHMMATASGVVIAVGELFGGGLAPLITGQVAQRFGIEHVLWLPIVMMGVGFLLSFLTRETRRKATKPAVSTAADA